MNESLIWCGVDVAKNSLSISLNQQLFEVANSTSGRQRLVERLRGMAAPVQVVCEASGGYEQPLVKRLQKAGFAIAVVEPARIRAFAKAAGIRAKTDPIDAAVIERFGRLIGPLAAPIPTEVESRLRELTRRRAQLRDLLTLESNQLAHLQDSLLRRQAKQLCSKVEKQIVQIEQELKKLVAEHQGLQTKAQTLEEVSGVGFLTAVTLLSEMPELGSIARGQAAALAGVAPYNQQSGNWEGARRIRGGRSAVRRALYMAALVGSRSNPILQAPI